MLMLANAERLAYEAMAAAFAPPPPVDYLAWAVKNIEFTKRESSEPGRAYGRTSPGRLMHWPVHALDPDMAKPAPPTARGGRWSGLVHRAACLCSGPPGSS